MGQARGTQGICLLSPGNSKSVPELSGGRKTPVWIPSASPTPSIFRAKRRWEQKTILSFVPTWSTARSVWSLVQRRLGAPHLAGARPPPPSSLRDTPVPQLSPAATAVVPYPVERAPSAFSPRPDLGTTGQESVGPVSRFLEFSLPGFWIPIAAPNSPSRLSPRRKSDSGAHFPPKCARPGLLRADWGSGAPGKTAGAFPISSGAAGRGRQASLSRAPSRSCLSGAASWGSVLPGGQSPTWFSTALLGSCLPGHILLKTRQK